MIEDNAALGNLLLMVLFRREKHQFFLFSLKNKNAAQYERHGDHYMQESVRDK